MIKNILLLSVVIAAAFTTSSCARIGPGGAAPGFVYSNVTYPNALNPNMEYRIAFDREDIEILGPVEASSTSYWAFFFVSSGDSGYGQLMRQARSMGADGVMNITIDTNFKWYVLVYARVTTKLTGLAYRYRRLSDEFDIR